MFCGVAVAAVVQVGGEALLVARALVVVPEPPEGLDRLRAARRPRHRRTRSCPRPRPPGILAPAAVRMLPPVSPQPAGQPLRFGLPRISHVPIQPQMKMALALHGSWRLPCP